jgi:hypothetical protein
MRIHIFLFLLAAGMAFAAIQVPPAQRARVETILSAVPAENPGSQVAAEDALVKEGKALLPALVELLAEKRARLRRANEPCKCMNHWEDDHGAAKLAAQILVLDQAIFRLMYNLNPRTIIVDWAHTLKFADGRAFTREFLPMPLADVETDRLQRIFPDYRFYLANLPGYQGGAAPPEELLRSLEVPAPLVQGVNLVAVDRGGRIRLATHALAHLELVVERTAPARPSGLDELFQDILPPVKTEAAAKDAAYAWLRLTTVFWRWGYQPLAFLPVLDTDLSATKERNLQITACGRVRVTPFNGNSGKLDATLIFDIGGKLLQVTETPAIEFGPIMLPPMSAPPGGGAAGLAPE